MRGRRLGLGLIDWSMFGKGEVVVAEVSDHCSWNRTFA